MSDSLIDTFFYVSVIEIRKCRLGIFVFQVFKLQRAITTLFHTKYTEKVKVKIEP